MNICKSCKDDNPNNFYKDNKHKCKKCCIQYGVNRYKNFSTDQRIDYKKYNSEWQYKNLFKYRLLSACNRAKRKGMEVTITIDSLNNLFIKQNGCCYYSGIPMEMNKASNYSMSIDRLDNSKWYTDDNVVLAASIVNTMKSTLSCVEFMTIIKAIATNQHETVGGTLRDNKVFS